MKMEAILPVQLLPRQRLRRRQQQLPQIPAVHLAVPANNASNTVSGSANNTSVQASTSENQNSTSDSADQSEADSKGNSVGAVETGDNTPILPFVIIGIAAAVIVAVLVYLKKKK